MRKVFALFLVLSMLFGVTGVTRAETPDLWTVTAYMTEYGMLQDYTKQVMEVMYVMVEVMNQKIDNGIKLYDCEIDLYFQYCLAILQLNNIQSKQGQVGSLIVDIPDDDDLMEARDSTYALLVETCEMFYDNWKNGKTGEEQLKSVLNTIRNIIDVTVYPENYATK